MLKSKIIGLIIISISMLLSCTLLDGAPDMVILNGNIYTVDKANPKAEAIAIKEGRIIAIGTTEEISDMIGEGTKTIDLKGKTVIPGIIESHAHFLGVGNAKMNLELNSTKNYDEIVALVKQAVASTPKGVWITGRGWHQEKWDKTPSPNIDGLPFHHKLSEVSPDNPVILRHASGHSSMVNAKAMELAGITKETPNPSGGEILKDKDGTPIGIFRENGDEAIYTAYSAYRSNMTPEQVNQERLQKLKLAQDECLSLGVTTFVDAGASFETIDFFKAAIDSSLLDIRLWVMAFDNSDTFTDQLKEYRTIGYGDNHLTVRAIKLYIDGALGSHGAWLLQPYDDLPASSGINVYPIDSLNIIAKAAIEYDYQLCVHAIGDRGNREILDIYDYAYRSKPGQTDFRWRIEHAQHLDFEDIPRFEQLGVIASMQGVHCTSDGPWVPKRIGDERSEMGAYVWQKLIESGATICNGTDAPVEQVDPFANFHSLVTRRLPDGSQFYPKQCMTREQALESYTINGAYAAFEEDLKGSLEVGKLADIVVLSQDIMTIPDDDIPDIEVLYTIIGGEVKYKK